MIYTVDLSGDLENNEFFLLLKNLILQMKNDSKEDVNRALLLLLKSMVENSIGDIEDEEIREKISSLLAKT